MAASMTLDPMIITSATSAAATLASGWSAVDVPLLLALPVLLALSAFFSGAETALFSMSEQERLAVRRGNPLAGRAVLTLVADQRMLLITILLGNMTINVLYFVISSVLMMRSGAGAAGQLVMALGVLLLIVLLGEIAPKMLATAQRTRYALVVAPLLLALHRGIGPLRVVLNRGVITPLTRLTAPGRTPPRLTAGELTALLETAGDAGVIDADEQRVLGEVISFREFRVRDVMLPRVRMTSVEAAATREQVMAHARATRRTKLPVHRGSLDEIVGILHVKRYLADPRVRRVTDPRVMTPPRFVPTMATLDQLLDQLRTARREPALVVDEYGGTAGIVGIPDVVQKLIGDLPGEVQQAPVRPRRIGDGERWQVDGRMPVHDWAEAFGQEVATPRVSTLGGLVIERLGRLAEPGDVVDVGNVRITVESVEQMRVASLIVTLRAEAPDDGGGDGEVPA